MSSEPPLAPPAVSGSSAPGVVDISFIVPLYNCLPLTQAMVASLRSTVPSTIRHEIILIDDGSTDGTRTWLATLQGPPFRVILNDRNIGFAATNNRAAAQARGTILCLLNNDLVLQAGWLQPMLAAHRRLGRRAGLIGNVQIDARTGQVDHTGIIFNLKAKPEHDRQPPLRLTRWFRPVRRVPAVTAACVLLSSSLWHELGGFDEGFVNGGEDVDLCFRASQAGRLNAVALRSVVRHHVSASAGRKLRDEANSHRLASKWGREFVRAAARTWCRTYIADMRREPRDYDPAFARRVWLYAVGLSARPPVEALEALDSALELEFVRWRQLLALAATSSIRG